MIDIITALLELDQNRSTHTTIPFVFRHTNGNTHTMIWIFVEGHGTQINCTLPLPQLLGNPNEV